MIWYLVVIGAIGLAGVWVRLHHTRGMLSIRAAMPIDEENYQRGFNDAIELAARLVEAAHSSSPNSTLARTIRLARKP